MHVVLKLCHTEWLHGGCHYVPVTGTGQRITACRMTHQLVAYSVIVVQEQVVDDMVFNSKVEVSHVMALHIVKDVL